MFTNYNFLGRVILPEMFFIGTFVFISIRTILWVSWKQAKSYNYLAIYFFKQRVEHFSHLVSFFQPEDKKCIYCHSKKQMHLQMPNRDLCDEYKLQHILEMTRKICLSCRLEAIKSKRILMGDYYSEIPIEIPKNNVHDDLHVGQSAPVLICDKPQAERNKNILFLETDESYPMGNRLSMSNNICFFDMAKRQKQIDEVSEAYAVQKKMVEERAENLICSFKPLDLAIHIYGQIPVGEHIQQILFEIFTEAAINAIVHSRASNLWIYIRQMEVTSRIEIENDGIIPTKQISDQGGLHSIREKMKRLNGKMELNMDERFCICLEIPNKSVEPEVYEEQWII